MFGLAGTASTDIPRDYIHSNTRLQLLHQLYNGFCHSKINQALRKGSLKTESMNKHNLAKTL